MDPDHEPSLKSAFAELRQRQSRQAPPVDAMRERAMRTAERPLSPPATGRIRRATVRLAWAVAACAVILALWWAESSMRRHDAPARETAANAEADALIAAIEQHFAIQEPAPEYPTDLLLVEHQSGLSP